MHPSENNRPEPHSARCGRSEGLTAIKRLVVNASAVASLDAARSLFRPSTCISSASVTWSACAVSQVCRCLVMLLLRSVVCEQGHSYSTIPVREARTALCEGGGAKTRNGGKGQRKRIRGWGLATASDGRTPALIALVAHCRSFPARARFAIRHSCQVLRSKKRVDGERQATRCRIMEPW